MSHPLFVRTLKEQEARELRQLIRSDGDARIVRRAQVVRLSARGKTPSEIAEILERSCSGVRKIINRFNEMESSVQQLGHVIAGTIHVFTVHTVGLYELAAPVRRFLRAHPQVNLRIEYSRSNRVYDQVKRGEADLGIVAYPIQRPQIAVIPFREDRLVLICPPCSKMDLSRALETLWEPPAVRR